MKNNIQPAEGKLGILIPGLGAVSTTLIAGVEAVIVGERRHQKRRREAALPTRQAGIEIDAALGVGRLLRQHFVVACDQPKFDARERRGGAERTHDGVNPVGAGERG